MRVPLCPCVVLSISFLLLSVLASKLHLLCFAFRSNTHQAKFKFAREKAGVIMLVLDQLFAVRRLA